MGIYNMAKNVICEQDHCDGGREVYLQMIQAAIDRMATSSAIFKGFAATIVAGVSAISFGDINSIVLILSFLPLVSFLALDALYLQIERRYRFLYEMVRKRNKEIDFDLRPPKVKDIPKTMEDGRPTKVRYINCFASESIWIFYVPAIAVCVTVTILKIGGIT